MAHRGAEGPRRSRIVGGRPDPDQSVEWEVEHYLAERTDRLVEEGWEPEEARREAERRFGEGYRTGMRAIERRRMRMMRMGSWLDFVVEALVGTVRSARRSPGFAAAVVLTLALGIGANAAMFGVADRLLLRPPLHVEEPGQVVRFALQRATGGVQATVTYPDIKDWESGRAFAAVATISHLQDWTLGAGPSARAVEGRYASWDFFTLLGASPAFGRFFTEEDDQIEAPLTAVLGYEFWRGEFGGDRTILGRTLEIAGHPATVVGVAPEGFTGISLERVDVWLPLDAAQYAFLGHDSWRNERGAWWLMGVARLADGVVRTAAEDEATRLHRSGRGESIAEGRYDAENRIVLHGLGETVSGEQSRQASAGRVVVWLMGVSLLLLLVACANVANLLLARSAGQRREVAVRLALGVSRRRLVAQTALRTIFLALVGGGIAVAVATVGGGALQRALLPEVHFPESGAGTRVLLFALAVSLAAGVVAGIMPALQGTRLDLSRDLREGSRGSSGRSRLRGALVVFQAAMSVVLLVGAGLFVQSLAEVRGLDLGLDVDRLLLGTLEFSAAEVTTAETNAIYGDAARRVSSIPGVEDATLTSVPLRWAFASALRIPGIDSIPRMPGGGPYYHAVSPGYFDAVGLRVEEGRSLEDRDDEGAARVALVSRSMADSLWGGEGAVGQCMLVGTDAEECTTVVGVVEEASRGGLEEEPFFAYYLPLSQTDFKARGLYVRAADPGAVAGEVARLLRSLSPGVRFARVETLREVLDPQARAWSLGAAMFSAFGILALLVAAVGLYSLLAFNVVRRTREIGIRAALGAERSRLLRQIVLEGARLTVVGVVLGLVVAVAAAPWARDLLFRVSPRDPLVLGGVAGALLIVALGASLLPGLRAARIEPSEALRVE